MGTRLISLCIVACLRGSAWPWNDSSTASACAEAPDANRGGSEGFSFGSGSSGSTSASPEQGSEWTVWGQVLAELEAIYLYLAEKLSCQSVGPPSDAETTSILDGIVAILNYFGWGLFGSQWISVRTAGARLTGLVIGLAILGGLQASVTAMSSALGALAWALTFALWSLRWMVTWGSTRPVRRR